MVCLFFTPFGQKSIHLAEKLYIPRRMSSVKGIIFGCLAGISYGTNPLGALHLYREGLSPETVLCYRFAWAIVLLGVLILLRRDRGGRCRNRESRDDCCNNGCLRSIREKFAVAPRDFPVLAALGFLFAACALTLFASFNYMDAGLASTLLFMYPLEVSIIMWLFFKERLTLLTAASIAVSLSGIALLYRGGADGASLSTVGFALVMVSSLTYSIYIVVVNRAKLQMDSVKLSFYAMVFCLLFLVLYCVTFGSGLPPIPANGAQWGWGLMLGFVPTVLSLVFMAKAIRIVGSTPTAITGALEPLTAVVIGVCAFDEAMSVRLAVGIALILAAVVLLAIRRR